ncbi:MAG: hypothetical protein LBC04_00555 [Holosporaceae bacterium]|jgi:hypothetical protein|nr:hypothetical protein [Holosporaceae bacterium]
MEKEKISAEEVQNVLSKRLRNFETSSNIDGVISKIIYNDTEYKVRFLYENQIKTKVLIVSGWPEDFFRN